MSNDSEKPDINLTELLQAYNKAEPCIIVNSKRINPTDEPIYQLTVTMQGCKIIHQEFKRLQ